MAKIFLSIPVLDRPDLKMMQSMFKACTTSKNHNVRLFFNENDSLISRVRNVHISTFLNEYTDCDYFMSLDSDIEIINRFASNNIFDKLVEHDLDFVGGLYSLKTISDPPSCASIPLDRSSSIPFNSGLKEMLWLSSGCWCLKRSAVQKMVDAYPELQYEGDDYASGKTIYGLYKPDIFTLEQNSKSFRKYLSEDWSFVQRWRALGGRVWADTSIVLTHHGKLPYNLWDVEVVRHSTNSNDSEQSSQQPDIPQPGYDL